MMSKYNLPAWNSIDSLSSTQFQKYLEKIENLKKRYKHFEIISNIPHIQLDLPKFDYKIANDQITKATKDQYTPINSRNYYETVEQGPGEHQYWSARALINYSTDSDKFFGNKDKEFATLSVPGFQKRAKKLLDENKELTLDDMEYYQTDIYKLVPYVTDYINTYICDKSYRIFLWKLKANGHIEWHNHSNLLWNKNLEVNESILVHIPIITNPLVEMLVKINDTVYSKYYEPGNVYIFNNTYDHAVINNWNMDRLHIVIMIPWTDKKIENLILNKNFVNKNDI